MEAVRKADHLIGRLQLPKRKQYGRLLFTEVARQRSRIVAIECYVKKYADLKRAIQESFSSKIDSLKPMVEVKPERKQPPDCNEHRSSVRIER